ncbi:MAG: hypothetical protein HYY06_09815 [Deltaproteobacteria bacterium]|nr:hypothetical protein [Deltaproteobacteria bacterium]
MRRFFPVVLAIAIPSSARAFSEDLCVEDGVLRNCYDVDCATGEATAACETQAMAQGAKILQLVGRSMVHTDATYLLAQAAGIDRERAYWIAAYDQATDSNQYVPFGQSGETLVDDPAACGTESGSEWCDWVTAVIDGVGRTSAETGGMFVHYSTPFNERTAAPVDGIDGLHPALDDGRHEPLLVDFRAWALGDGDADVDPMCAAGLTALSDSGDYGTAATCYPGGETLSGTMPILGMGGGYPMRATLGDHVIQTSDGGDFTWTEMEAVEPTWTAEARLGIYLHTLADRISHHVCGDASRVNGPRAATGDFIVTYDDDECEQGIHGLRHAWEVGVSPLYETTPAALDVTYDELVVYAESLGIRSHAAKEEIVAAALEVLEIVGAQERLDAMTALLDAWGEPLPGTGEASDPDPDAGPDRADAGAPADAGVDPPGGSESGCATAPGRPGRAAVALLAVIASLGIGGARRRMR